MASELYVETLKGLTSGANANKVIIPSGQTLEIGDGLATSNMPTGSVIGVYQSTLQGGWSTTSASWSDITDLTVTITPQSASSKFLVSFDVTGGNTTGGGGVKIVRDISGVGSTNIMNGINWSSRTPSSVGNYYTYGDNNSQMTNGVSKLDAPNTTNSITYKLQARLGVSGGTFQINNTVNQTDVAYTFLTTSHITVMEIAG